MGAVKFVKIETILGRRKLLANMLPQVAVTRDLDIRSILFAFCITPTYKTRYAVYLGLVVFANNGIGLRLRWALCNHAEH